MVKRLIVLLFTLVALAGGAVACGFGGTPTATPSPTPTLLSLQAPGWEEVTIHTLCLEVEQSYPALEGKEPEPIDETAQRILARIGVRVVSEGAACDATLTVTLSGRALGASYIPAGYCYNGAEVEGQVLFTVPGREQFALPISAVNPPPDSISMCHAEPIDAPFHLVWPEPLLDALANLWGPQVLIQALKDEDIILIQAAVHALMDIEPGAKEAVPVLIQALGDGDEVVRRSAASALGRIGPEAREAVPALIQALGDEDGAVVQFAAEALEDITGQDFGEDAAAWQEWWEEQQQQ